MRARDGMCPGGRRSLVYQSLGDYLSIPAPLYTCAEMEAWSWRLAWRPTARGEAGLRRAYCSPRVRAARQGGESWVYVAGLPVQVAP